MELRAPQDRRVYVGWLEARMGTVAMSESWTLIVIVHKLIEGMSFLWVSAGKVMAQQ